MKTTPHIVFLVLKLKQLKVRDFSSHEGWEQVANYPTSVVKKGPQVAPLSRGRVYTNISNILTIQTRDETEPSYLKIIQKAQEIAGDEGGKFLTLKLGRNV